jgi:hypothetical protein
MSRFLRFVNQQTETLSHRLVCDATSTVNFDDQCGGRAFQIFESGNGREYVCVECGSRYGEVEVSSAPLSDD